MKDPNFNNDTFYVPFDEDISELSGIVVVLCGEFPDPTSAISFISKKEDVDKVLRIIEETVNWKIENEFDPISDWHLPSLVELCRKYSEIKYIGNCWELELSKPQLSRALKVIEDSVDWNTINVFGPVSDWHVAGLLEICQKNGQIKITETCPQFQKVDLQTPSGNGQTSFYVKPLGQEYANLINDNWKFRDDASFHWINSQCKNGMAFGTFSSSSSDVKEPISWIMAYKYGALGLLKTKEEWRGKGCAKACIKSLEDKLLSLGVTPYCYIEDFNVTSMGLFEKLGYEKAHESYWIIMAPKSSTE